MDVWAISDLHLGPGGGKGHYSSKWFDHQPAIRQAWDRRVPEEAVVLMPGDFSWNQDPIDLAYDYAWIDDRPGRLKVMTAGNHDYGVWTNRSRVHEFCSQFDTLQALLGEATRIENPLDNQAPGIVVAGTIGSMTEGDDYFESKGGFSKQFALTDPELLEREMMRFERALLHAQAIRKDGDTLILMLHYPPFANLRRINQYTRRIQEAGVDLCLYGHLHQQRQWPSVTQGAYYGVSYRFVGADFLNWKPVRIGEFDSEGFLIDRVRRRASINWSWAKFEKEWKYVVSTHDPKDHPQVEIVEASKHATEPPPGSEDWDENSASFGIRLDDLDAGNHWVGQLDGKVKSAAARDEPSSVGDPKSRYNMGASSKKNGPKGTRPGWVSFLEELENRGPYGGTLIKDIQGLMKQKLEDTTETRDPDHPEEP